MVDAVMLDDVKVGEGDMMTPNAMRMVIMIAMMSKMSLSTLRRLRGV